MCGECACSGTERIQEGITEERLVIGISNKTIAEQGKMDLIKGIYS